MKQLAIAFDQLVNCLIPPYWDAWADETFSARCWRNGMTSRRWAIMRSIVDGLFFFDKAHCHTSFINEMGRKQLPTEYSNGTPV